MPIWQGGSRSVKRFLSIALVLLIFPILTKSPPASAWAEPDDFRGIRWGTSLSDLPGMVFQNQEGGIDYFTREGDKLAIGSTLLETLKYGFCDKRFCLVVIYFNGRANLEYVKLALESKYGSPKQVNPRRHPETYQWSGSSILISLAFSRIRQQARLFYAHLPTYKQWKEKRKSGAQHIGGDI